VPPADVSSAATHTAVDGSGGNVADGAAVVCRYYSDYDEDAEADGDVISIHDDDSEPESSTTEPAAKQSRLSDDAATTTAAETETEVTMMEEYWQANSYNVRLAAENTDDADVLFANCRRLRNAACLCVDLKPGEMLYLPASWLYEVLHADIHSFYKKTITSTQPNVFTLTFRSLPDRVPTDLELSGIVVPLSEYVLLL